ncbi:hypothetical protein [Caulobacter mirabilis]|nr:hypothetical protein [Caulobacter mirabilis]
MRAFPILLPLILACGWTGVARAAEAGRCWFENGAVVVPARVGDVAGDWILDPASPRTLLHETKAQMEGLPAAFTAAASLAGRRVEGVDVTVADLDSRAPGFTTPIAGVIGADVLARFVVDLDFSPCRVRLIGGRPPVLKGSRLRLTQVDGVPALEAGVADDRQAGLGLFAVDWGSKAAVRLSQARLSPSPTDPVPDAHNGAPGRLRALSLAGALYEEQTAAVGPSPAPSLAGTLGTDFWSRWRLRLDIRGGVLTLAPK